MNNATVMCKRMELGSLCRIIYVFSFYSDIFCVLRIKTKRYMCNVIFIYMLFKYHNILLTPGISKVKIHCLVTDVKIMNFEINNRGLCHGSSLVRFSDGVLTTKARHPVILHDPRFVFACLISLVMFFYFGMFW